MKNKSDARDFLHNFFILVKNQFNKFIKLIRTDNEK